MATVTSSKRQLTHTSNTYESNGDVTIGGNLNINGTTTTIDTANLLVEDKNIIIGDVSSPTDVTADFGGITLKGATDKTINWVNSTNAWTSNQIFSAPNLTLTSLSAQNSEATALVVNGSNVVGIRELGSNAFNSTSFLTSYTETDTLSSVLARGATSTQSITSLNTNATSLAGLSIGETFVNYDGWGSQLNVHGGSHSRLNVKTSTVRMGVYAHNSWHSISASVLNGYVGTYTNHGLGFLVNSSPKMVINTSGQVGINQTSPTSQLHVGGVIAATGGTSTNWNAAYGWGNHASSGYLTSASTASTLTHNANRTDSTTYPVTWMSGSSSPAYSCAAVTITSSAGRVNATTFNGALTGNATTATTAANSTLLGGASTSVSASNNTIVKRASGGYIYANYINTTANDVTSGVTKVMVETGNDGFMRHGSAAAIRSFINVADGANNYSHPTSAGNKHVPTGGAAGQFLKYSSSGTATWATPSYIPNTDTNTTYSAGSGLKLSGTTFRLNGGEIPSGVNLNTYRTTGVYSQNSNADATAGSNWPANAAGILEVWNDDYGNGIHCTQRYSQYNTTNVYNRNYYNGTWTAWRDLTQDTNTVYTLPSNVVIDSSNYSVSNRIRFRANETNNWDTIATTSRLSRLYRNI